MGWEVDGMDGGRLLFFASGDKGVDRIVIDKEEKQSKSGKETHSSGCRTKHERKKYIKKERKKKERKKEKEKERKRERE